MKTFLLLLSLLIGIHAHAQDPNDRSETKASAAAPSLENSRPNVILIMTDDLDHPRIC